jgi:hypothetical protein
MYIVTHAEEGGFHPVAVEQVEHPGRDFRYGTIIKSEIDRFLRRYPYPPERFRKQ